VHWSFLRLSTAVFRLSVNVSTYPVHFIMMRHCLRFLVTFRVSRRRRKMYMYIVLGHLCVSVCLSLAACPHYCTEPDVTWGNGRGCPLVVYCWADLQLVHGFHCYDNIARTRNVSKCFVLALYLVLVVLGSLWKVFSDALIWMNCRK